MDFKELLLKYQYGDASEEEIKLVEEEISKHEAIEEYLSDSLDIGLEKDNQEDINKETATVKKSVNKKLRKVILTSVTIVFSIIFIIFYIISPAISSFYYNPSAKTLGKYNQDIYFDLKAFTELNLPGYGLQNASASENLGFGVYNIYFRYRNLFTEEEKDIDAKIKRNARIGSFTDFLKFKDIRFDCIMTADMDDYLIGQQNKKVIDHMKELNSVSYISAYITFKKDKDVKELNDLIEKYGKISFKWVGVRTEPPGKPIQYLSGFNPNFNDNSVTNDGPDKSKYPCLQLIDCRDSFKSINESIMPASFNAHYTSLLKYMIDRGKAVKALDYSGSKTEYYKNALSYVNKNGVKTYGVLIYGEARDMLDFINNEEFNSIEIDNVIASKKYIN